MLSRYLCHCFILCLFSSIIFNDRAQAAVDQKKAFKEAQRGEAVIIDVRDSVDIGADAIAGARWVRFPYSTHDLPKILDSIASCVGTEKKVYIYCYVGNWADYFTEGLRARGVQAFSAGGYDTWTSQKIPTSLVNQPPINEFCR